MPASAPARPAGSSPQPDHLASLCEQLCTDSAAAAAAALKAAATGSALLNALASSSGSGGGQRELLLGQLVLQDLQLLQHMQDNVLLQLRIVLTARALRAAPAAQPQLPPVPLQQLLEQLGQLVRPAGGGSGVPAPLDAGADGQDLLAQLALQLQLEALAQPQQQALPLLSRQQNAGAGPSPTQPSSSSGDVQQLQQVLTALQQQGQQQPPPQQRQQAPQQPPPSAGAADAGFLLAQPSAAANGDGSSNGEPTPDTDASCSPGLEAQLLAALRLLRGSRQDAGLEPPSLYSEQAAGPSSGSQQACNGGQPAAQQLGDAGAGGTAAAQATAADAVQPG